MDFEIFHFGNLKVFICGCSNSSLVEFEILHLWFPISSFVDLQFLHRVKTFSYKSFNSELKISKNWKVQKQVFDQVSVLKTQPLVWQTQKSFIKTHQKNRLCILPFLSKMMIIPHRNRYFSYMHQKSTKIGNFLFWKCFISIMKFIATKNLSVSELQIYPASFQKNVFFEFHISHESLKTIQPPPQNGSFWGGLNFFDRFVSWCFNTHMLVLPPQRNLTPRNCLSHSNYVKNP